MFNPPPSPPFSSMKTIKIIRDCIFDGGHCAKGTVLQTDQADYLVGLGVAAFQQSEAIEKIETVEIVEVAQIEAAETAELPRRGRPRKFL